MIGRIRGKLIEKQAADLLLEVGGLCYEVLVPMSTLYQLPEVGQEVTLHTHFVVREDAQILYGFYDVSERLLFRTLIKVNGVGPKMALALLSGMAVQEFVATVRANDVAALVKMPGVGKKTAERLLVELRDKIGEWDSSGLSVVPVSGKTGSRTSGISHEAETALVSLGYKPQQAARSIALILEQNQSIADSETLIRLALKGML